MNPKVVAVLVDNGESLLECSLLSLREQSVRPFIIVSGGPRTDYELARSLADKVLGPTSGIGRARIKGILESEADCIISADSDTIYWPGYVEAAVQDLQILNAVKAGRIQPFKWSPSSAFEATFIPLLPYEFSLAFRKNAFINAGIHREDYSLDKADIGYHVLKLLPVPDIRMGCTTRLPTYWGDITMKNYLPSMFAAGAILGGMSLVPLANEISKLLRQT
jgi:hypothetical protein